MSNKVDKQILDKVSLHAWQQTVIQYIEEYELVRDSEQYQGLNEYSINKSIGVSICLPRHSGHTFLANYIASKYPSLLVYTTMDHYRQLTERFPLHPKTQSISMFEIFYAVFKPTKHEPTAEFAEIQKKFKDKKAVVIDNARSVLVDMQDLIYHNAQCSVVMLGH